MSFGIFVLGALIALAGVLYAEHLAHVPPKWMGVTALVIIGGAILSAASQTRQKDPNS